MRKNGSQVGPISEDSDIDAGSDDDDAYNDLNLGEAELQEVQPVQDADLRGFSESDSDFDDTFESFHSIWKGDQHPGGFDSSLTNHSTSDSSLKATPRGSSTYSLL